MFENSVNIEGRSQVTIASAAASALLTPGVYDIWADADQAVHVKLADTSTEALTASSSNGYLIRANNTIPVRVQSEAYIGFAGTGALHIHQVG